jgi:hypothetical protein
VGIDVSLQAFRKKLGGNLLGIRGQNGELIAADPGQNIRIPEGLPENSCRIHKHRSLPRAPGILTHFCVHIDEDQSIRFLDLAAAFICCSA